MVLTIHKTLGGQCMHHISHLMIRKDSLPMAIPYLTHTDYLNVFATLSHKKRELLSKSKIKIFVQE